MLSYPTPRGFALDGMVGLAEVLDCAPRNLVAGVGFGACTPVALCTVVAMSCHDTGCYASNVPHSTEISGYLWCGAAGLSSTFVFTIGFAFIH